MPWYRFSIAEMSWWNRCPCSSLIAPGFSGKKSKWDSTKCTFQDILHPLLTHFTHKIQLITFLNERGKISPVRHEGQFNTQVTEGVRVIWTLPWNDENTINTIILQNTSLKEHTALATYQNAVRTPLAVQCSSSRTFCSFNVPTRQCVSKPAQSGCL